MASADPIYAHKIKYLGMCGTFFFNYSYHVTFMMLGVHLARTLHVLLQQMHVLYTYNFFVLMFIS